MNNTIFSLNNGYHIGFGTLKDIDSYMIETEENLKIKYNVYIEDENRDTHYFYHKGGKPSESIYNSLNKKMFFIVNENDEIEYISDLITNKNINEIIKNIVSEEKEYWPIKLGALMSMFLLFFMFDNSSLIGYISCILLGIFFIASYLFTMFLGYTNKKQIEKERECLKKDLKEWIDNKES